MTKWKIIISCVAALVILIFAAGIGSVYVPPADVARIVFHEIFGGRLPARIDPGTTAIIWQIRLPRVCMAFIVGFALSVSGAVMQSVLRNPLASSYTLGVSSGASLVACVVIVSGFTLPVIGRFTLPLLGLIGGFVTVVAAVTLANVLDKRMGNYTIILVGMIVALFVSAIITLLLSIFRNFAESMIFWQMGSFSLRTWADDAALLPITVIGSFFVMRYGRELDILTFGDEQARSMGVNTRQTKWILLALSAALTGSAVSFVGVVGFVDLVAPHLTRRVFGASHRVAVPMAGVWGGAFMVAADLAARTVIAPQELPVGAVTALIGAPFFVFVYVSSRKKAG